MPAPILITRARKYKFYNEKVKEQRRWTIAVILLALVDLIIYLKTL